MKKVTHATTYFKKTYKKQYTYTLHTLVQTSCATRTKPIKEDKKMWRQTAQSFALGSFDSHLKSSFFWRLLTCLRASWSKNGPPQGRLFIILLQRSQIFASFRELTFLHAFAHIVVDKSTLRVPDNPMQGLDIYTYIYIYYIYIFVCIYEMDR